MFKPSHLSSAIAAITALSMQTAFAQDEVIQEEIVITGIRASLSQALDIKRDNKQIVDAIVAEDIGKFPDNNVVEALQRVTGVQVNARGAGEVNGVTIRGLPDLSTTVNGRNIFTTSGRQVAIADIPASLVNRVDVYKTRSANLLEHGIAGVLDVHTHRPFNFDGTKFVFAGRMVYQDQPEETDPVLSFLASSRWETGVGDFGALINISQAEASFRDEAVTVGAFFPYFTGTLEPQVPMPPADPGYVPYQRIPESYNGAQVWVPGLESGLPIAAGSTLPLNGGPVEYLMQRDAVFASDFTGERERPAVNVSLQWAPNDASEYLFEAFYNGYRQDTFNDLFFTFIDNPNQTGLPANHIQLVPGSNLIVERQINTPFIFTSGDFTTNKTDSFMYALGGKWDITEEFKLQSELVYQTSEFDQEFFAMRATRTPYRMWINTNPGNGIPAYEFFDNPDVAGDQSVMTNPADWAIAELYDNADFDEGDATTFTIDGDWETDIGFIEKVEFGFRWDNRAAAESQWRRGGSAIGGFSYADLEEAVGVPGAGFINENFFDGRTNMPSTWIVPDGAWVHANKDAIRDVYVDNGVNVIRRTSELYLQELFSVDETNTAAYVQADFETELAGHTVDGQFGLRYVKIDTEMTFTDWTVENNPVTEMIEASASEVLPSLMVRYYFTEDLLARFAYGETIRRPNFADLNPIINYNPTVTATGRGTANSGNPNLEPTESKNFDFSLEWYFAESSSVYGTLFKRDIEGFVVPTNSFLTYDNPDDEDDPLNGNYTLTVPNNSSNGELEGYELGLVWFPENLPRYLDGFGVQASYTALDSTQDLPEFNQSAEIVGYVSSPLFLVSDSSYSVVLAYEKETFDARLSYVWRDAYKLDNDAPIFANPLARYSSEEESLDFQLSYHVNDNLTFTFDATNLTDPVFQTNYGGRSELMNFGSIILTRTYALGVRFNY